MLSGFDTLSTFLFLSSALFEEEPGTEGECSPSSKLPLTFPGNEACPDGGGNDLESPALALVGVVLVNRPALFCNPKNIFLRQNRQFRKGAGSFAKAYDIALKSFGAFLAYYGGLEMFKSLTVFSLKKLTHTHTHPEKKKKMKKTIYTLIYIFKL